MELLHLVNHGGLPLQHYLIESSDIDVAHLYAYLEMIYMGLLVQQVSLQMCIISLWFSNEVFSLGFSNKNEAIIIKWQT